MDVTNMHMQPTMNYVFADTSSFSSLGLRSVEIDVRKMPPKLQIITATSNPASVSFRNKYPKSDAQNGPVLKMI